MELVPLGEDGDEMEHTDKAHEETIEVSLPQSAPLLLLRITSLPLLQLLPRLCSFLPLPLIVFLLYQHQTRVLFILLP